MRKGRIWLRAEAIRGVANAKKGWQHQFGWFNHLGATHEFQLLDVLRDIRSVLTFIAVLLLLVLVFK